MTDLGWREYAMAFAIDELLHKVFAVSGALGRQRILERAGGRHQRIAGVMQGQQRPREFAARRIPTRQIGCRPGLRTIAVYAFVEGKIVAGPT